MKKRIICLLTIAVLLLCACPLSVNAVGDGIDFSRDKVDLYLNQTFQLTLKDNAGEVEFQSSDPYIVSVTEKGLVTAKALGSSIITAADNNGHVASCTVNVMNGTSPTGVKLESQVLNLTEGESRPLNARVEPDNAENTRLYYSSSNTYVAKVDKNGNIRALKAGVAVITAESASAAVSSGCIVHVEPKSGSSRFSVAVNGTMYSIKGEKKANMLVELNSANETFEATTDTEGKFFFDNINQGVYTVSVYKNAQADTPEAAGQLTVGSHDMSVTCILNHKELVMLTQTDAAKGDSVREIKLEKTTVALDVNESYDAVFKVTPSGAAAPAMKGVSKNGKIAMVDSDGRITGIAEGSTTVTFTSADGRFVLTCKVIVTSSGRNTYSWIIITAISIVLLLVLVMFIISYRKFIRNKELSEGIVRTRKKGS